MTKDGRRLEIALSLSPIKNRLGTVVGFSGIGRDITEHRRARTASAGWAFTIPSPAYRTEPCSRTACARLWPRPSAITGKRRCCCSISTISKTSTTRSATRPETGCLWQSRAGSTLRWRSARWRAWRREFALILTELQRPEDAAAVARKAVRVVAECFRLENQEVHTTASVGITIYPTDSDDPDQLLRDADLALYRAKAEGRNTYRFYAAAMGAQVEARRALERDLRLALERGELQLHFQPQLDFAAGCIDGAEALVRWRHPRRGSVPPPEFIPLAETSGLIVPLGAWALREACRQARAWRDAGLPPLTVAVNLSLAQCRNGDFRA